MFDTLEIVRMAAGSARHANLRQTVVAQNIAHANTPGYRAQDIPSFAETVSEGPQAQAMRRTRANHLPGSAAGFRNAPRAVDGTRGPDGNTVSIETEMMRTAELRMQHDTALAIYRSAISAIRSSLGQR